MSQRKMIQIAKRIILRIVPFSVRIKYFNCHNSLSSTLFPQVFIIIIIQMFLIHNTGGCKCGDSCRMGNGRIGTCQEDNETCAQNINQPFCPEGKYNQNLIGTGKVDHFTYRIHCPSNLISFDFNRHKISFHAASQKVCWCAANCTLII